MLYLPSTGMARLLKQTSMTEEQWEYVKAISQSGETLLNIVNDILDVSKIGIVCQSCHYLVHLFTFHYRKKCFATGACTF